MQFFAERKTPFRGYPKTNTKKRKKYTHQCRKQEDLTMVFIKIEVQ